MPGGGGLVSTRLHFPGLNLSRCEANFLKHYLILTTQFKNLNRQNLKETCMRLVVNCNILISLVDTPEFRACCKMANPQTRSPMCNITYLNKGIPEKARMIKCAIISHLKILDFIGLTCDSWPSPSHTLMLGVTTHWISDNLQAQSVILSLKTIHGPHSGINLCSHVHNTLEKFDITSKLYCVTTNNISNNQTMVKALEGLVLQFITTKHCIGCMAHVINLVEKTPVETFDAKRGGKVQLKLPPCVDLLVKKRLTGNVSLFLTRVQGFLK